jgi:hypothetical protein
MFSFIFLDVKLIIWFLLKLLSYTRVYIMECNLGRSKIINIEKVLPIYELQKEETKKQRNQTEIQVSYLYAPSIIYLSYYLLLNID